jgi:O-antigen/teichoic acid export membrane protein
VSTDRASGAGAIAWVEKTVDALRTDHLTRNSAFILLTSATMAGLGFVFWLVSTRLYTPQDVGVGGTLISASSLLAYASLLGCNQMLVRALPGSGDRSRELDTGVVLVAAATTVTATAYVAVVPAHVPALSFLHESPLLATGFVVLSVTGAVNLLTDSAFVAFRRAGWNVVVDGLVQGGTKLLLPLGLVALGGYGLFAASGAAGLVAAACSVALLARKFAYRPRLRVSGAVVRDQLAFSSSAYLAHLLDMAPAMVLPVLVIRARGAEEAGVYFIAFQVAGLLYAATYAVAQSTFAEGAYAEAAPALLARRSARLLVATLLPASAALAALSPFVLQPFGDAYTRGAGTLALLSLSAPAVGVCAWTAALLKLTGQLRALTLSSLAHAVGTCGLAWLWADDGVTHVALAFLVGSLLGGAVGCAALASLIRDALTRTGGPA